MRNYRLITDYYIEANCADAAEIALMIDNSSTSRETTTENPFTARAAFIEAKKDLSTPKKLTPSLWWFSGVMLESFEIDEGGEEIHPQTEAIFVRDFDEIEED